MTTYSVRCRNYRCRHRRVSTIDPATYLRVPKCPECGLTKGWRIEQRQYTKRDRCYCSGIPHPHKKASMPCCDFHPQGAYNQAKRRGVSDEDIPLEHLGKPMDDTDECPF